ncbi:MAG: hypothetical protein LQ348_001979, partial [Seirophora lacunosa]
TPESGVNPQLEHIEPASTNERKTVLPYLAVSAPAKAYEHIPQGCGWAVQKS